MTARHGRLDVGVVGTGRVGAVLGSALRAVGHRVVAVSASSDESRERADALLHGVPVREVPDVVGAADLVLLTVPDDALGPLVDGLATLGAFRPGQLVVHTAGAHGCDILGPATDAGAIALAIHPAMTFTGTSLDVARLTGCPFAVTAAAPMLPVAQALVVELGGEPVVLEESARVVYHAALTHGANHLVTLVAQARRVLRELGVEEPGAMLAPLLQASLDGALRSGESLLTGPVVRGDAGTVAAHVAALDALAADARNPDGPPADGLSLPDLSGDARSDGGRDPDSPPLGGRARSSAPEVPGRPGVGDDDVSPARLDDVAATYRHLAATTARRSQALGRLTASDAARILDAVRPH